MTYFKLPTNTNKNIDDSNLKLILNKQLDVNQICSYNLSLYLQESKKKIDEVYNHWDFFKIYTNPYEFIHTHVPNSNLSVSKYKPISRAFYKILEIYNLFNLLNYAHPIKTFHLAEGPGGFLEATNFLRKNPKDEYYGMTLIEKKNSVPGWKKSRNVLNKFKNIIIENGFDDTGDLYNEDNYKYCCQKYTNKFEIITGDGGIDFSDNYNNQEIMATRLIITQIFYGLSMQKQNGTFILKVFDLFCKASIDAVYLLSLYYNKIYIVKPYTSRYANSEKYIVCVGFNKPITRNIKYKFWSILKILKKVDLKKYNIASILNIEQPIYFMNYIEEINITLGQRQIENILNTIKYIKNKDKSKERLDKLKVNNVSKCIKWCETNNVENHKFKDLLLPKNIFLKK